TLVRCDSCGSACTIEPAPAEAHTSGVYAERPPRLARPIRALQRVLARKPVRMLGGAGVPAGARVLDAGAGAGRLLTELRDAGYGASGIDPAPRSPAVAREGIEQHDDAELAAVVLWHVLEHLPDPAGAAGRVAGWLAPGGVLVVGVPNIASLQARIAGGEW